MFGNVPLKVELQYDFDWPPNEPLLSFIASIWMEAMQLVQVYTMSGTNIFSLGLPR